MTLLQQFEWYTAKQLVAPMKWVKERVDTSDSIPELRELLASPRTTSYERMHAIDRLRALGADSFLA